MVAHLNGSIAVVILEMYLVSGRTFKCSFDYAKSKFFRAFNAIYSKIGGTASEETILTLWRAKYILVFSYAEACPLLSRQKHSMEFAITRLFMKIFKTGLPTIIIECQRHFTFLLIVQQSTIRLAKFLQCFIASENVVCSLFTNVAIAQLKCIFSANASTVLVLYVI